MFDFDLLKTLSETDAPSGYEKKISDIIISRIKNTVDSLRIDKMGNIIAVIGNGKPTFFAHTDEVGFMVKGITDTGLIKIDSIGGVNPEFLLSQKLLFKSGAVGVISSIPVHFHKNNEKIKFSDLLVDIGANSKEEAENKVAVGDYAVFKTKFEYLSEKDLTFMGKALDNRLGVYAMIKIIEEKIIENGTFVFSVQEETGLRGAKAFCYNDFDLGISIDTTTAFDFPGVDGINSVVSLNHGVAISYVDRATIYDNLTVTRIISASNEKNISIQVKSFCAGGNDASSIQKTAMGHKPIALSLPVRNIHSALSVASNFDLDSLFDVIRVISDLYAEGDI